jgi:hypothetical protein
MRENMIADKLHDYVIKCSMIQIFQSDLVDLLRGSEELPIELKIKLDDRDLIYV